MSRPGHLFSPIKIKTLQLSNRVVLFNTSVQPRRIIEATEEGARAAWNI